MLLGALMFGIGVLLLIGYNWARLPVNGKIAIIMSSVALAFGGSAVTYARQHRLAGEILAFIGVLLYGNAIWLIAQVLHIRGNFPDAFMWWAIGALVCAWLVRSRVIGVAPRCWSSSGSASPPIRFSAGLASHSSLLGCDDPGVRAEVPGDARGRRGGLDGMGVLDPGADAAWRHLCRCGRADGLRLLQHWRVASRDEPDGPRVAGRRPCRPRGLFVPLLITDFHDATTATP